jgi:hypothetical protein
MSDKPERRSHMVERAIRHPDDTATHIERVNGANVVWAPGLPAVPDQHTVEERAQQQQQLAHDQATSRERAASQKAPPSHRRTPRRK